MMLLSLFGKLFILLTVSVIGQEAKLSLG